MEIQLFLLQYPYNSYKSMNSNHSIIIEAQYFPPIQYFVQLIQNPHITIEAFENYQKGSYRNRCHIANSIGVQVLSVPLRKGKNEKQVITEVAISYDMNWQKQHWQSIKTAYGSAPFWDHYVPQLEPLFNKKFDYLFDLNIVILETFLKILKLKNTVKISMSNDYELHITEGGDCRNKILPNDASFNGEKYAQIFQERTGFLPNLSALDLILCTGPQASSILSHSLVH